MLDGIERVGANYGLHVIHAVLCLRRQSPFLFENLPRLMEPRVVLAVAPALGASRVVDEDTGCND